MEININGSAVECPSGTSVASLLSIRDIPTSGTAVAVNDAIVPRKDWEARTLRPGDRITLISAAFGG